MKTYSEGQWFQKYRSNYLDVSNDPLYPFGYGLSYTNFKYSNISLSDAVIKGKNAITASITITNTGKIAGNEVVQLYTQQLVGSITRPVKELKGFKKINLKAGESKTINFLLQQADLKFYNSNLKFIAEPGDYKIYIGTNSRDVKEATIKLAL